MPDTSARKRRTAAPRIAFDAPPHVIEQIKKRALSERTTIRVVILDALKAAGIIDIAEEDILDKRLMSPGRPRKIA